MVHLPYDDRWRRFQVAETDGAEHAPDQTAACNPFDLRRSRATLARPAGIAGKESARDARSGCRAAEALMERGVLAKDTHGSTIRLAPPLVFSAEDLGWAVEQLRLGASPRDHNLYHRAIRWCTSCMPTARRRYQVTETDPVERALDEAVKHWPAEPRSRLVVRVIQAGGEALAERDRAREQVESRRVVLLRVAGSYTQAFGLDYLSGLRDDWPE